jgi:uncharacterized protein YqgC (DUF456 family)
MPASIVTILVGVAMFAGIVGIFIPLMPDILLIWGAGLAYGLIVGWGSLGPWMFGLMTILGIIGLLTDLWLTSLGGKIGGASLTSILVGIFAGFVGMIFLSPVGGIFVMLGATFYLEYRRLKDTDLAVKGMLGVAFGYGASIAVKVGIALTMILLWVIWVLWVI